MRLNLVGLAVGVVFGFWLGWTRFTSYDVILRTLLLQDAYLWLVFSSAVASAGLSFFLLRQAGVRTLLDGSPLDGSRTPILREHVVGSVLFGAGWAVAGACPGPAIAQVGRGQLSGLFIVAGIFVGVALQGEWARRAAAASLAAPRPSAGACAN